MIKNDFDPAEPHNSLFQIIYSDPDGKVIVDPEGIIMYANPAFARLFGKSINDLTGEMFGFPVIDNQSSEIQIVSSQGCFTDAEMRVVQINWQGSPANLVSIRDVTGRKKAEKQLSRTLQATKEKELEVNALLYSTKAVLDHPEFARAASVIFEHAKKLIGATAGYVALINPEGTENTVLFLDSGGHQCSVDPDLPMPIRGLRSEAVHNDKTVYNNDFSSSDYLQYIPEGHAVLQNVLFTPLREKGRVVGLIGLANKEGGFSQQDAVLAERFGDIASISLQKSRSLELLSSSEEKYRSLYTSMNEGVALHEIIYDGDGNAVDYVITDVNPAYEKLTGIAKKYAVGNKASQIYRSSSPPFLEIYSRVARTGVPFKFDTFFEPLQKYFSISVFSASEGTFATVFSDITEARENARKLAESEEHFRIALAHSSVIVATADLELRYTWIHNPHPDFDPASVTGKRDDEIAVNEGTTKLVSLKQRVIDTQAHASDEITFPLSGGQITYNIEAEPLFDEAGIICGVATVASDITEHKQMENALKERYKESTCLFSISQVIKEDLALNELAERILGIIPAGWQFPEKTRVRMVLWNNEYKSDNYEDSACKLAADLQVKNGKIGFIEVGYLENVTENEADPFLPEERTLLHSIAMLVSDYLENTTSREANRKLEAQLRQSQKMEAVGRLAGGVAHDFNNLLTVIMGYCQLLLAEEENQEKKADLEEIFKAGERASGLTRQLLTFSRMQPSSPRALNLNETVEGMTKMLQRLIGENIKLITSLKPELPLINIDPSQMEQVILNLVVNARDAMPQGGTLSISTSIVKIDSTYCRTNSEASCGRFIRLMIEDTGTGMDEDTKAKMFEPFFTTKPQGEGSGLGLSVTYGIIKQADGWINAYSEPGQGSTFSVYMPVRNQEEPIEEKLEAKHEKTIPDSTILLVEDENGVRKLAERILEKKGYRVVSASGVSHAEKIFKEHASEIDLLFTDIILPDGNGIELINRLVSIKPSLAILTASGYANHPDHQDIITQYNYGFLNKPYSSSDLLDAVAVELKKNAPYR